MSAEASKVTQRDLFANVTSEQRMPTTRASRGWELSKNCRLNRQKEASKKMQSGRKNLHVAEEIKKSKWHAAWGNMFLKADLLFIELKICGLNCHHYTSLFVLFQEFKLLGCILLTGGLAGQAGRPRKGPEIYCCLRILRVMDNYFQI